VAALFNIIKVLKRMLSAVTLCLFYVKPIVFYSKQNVTVDCILCDIIVNILELKGWLDGSTRYQRALHNVKYPFIVE